MGETDHDAGVRVIEREGLRPSPHLVQTILEKGAVETERLRKIGWTQQDFANELSFMLYKCPQSPEHEAKALAAGLREGNNIQADPV